jgi:hypothetical protein
MAEKPRMLEAERNARGSGSMSRFVGANAVELLKRGLRRARRRLSKKIIELELKEKDAKAHHR